MALSYKELSQVMIVDMQVLAQETYRLQVERMPELNTNIDKTFIEKGVRDTGYTILYLANAVGACSIPLFINYCQWLADIMSKLSFDMRYITINMQCMLPIVESHYGPEVTSVLKPYIDKAIAAIESPSHPLVPPESDHALASEQKSYTSYLLDGERHKASDLINNLVAKGIELEEIYIGIFQDSQRQIGYLWQTRQISVAKEHFCTASTQMIMSQFYARIFATPKRPLVFVGACVGGELHELGVRMVSDMMELAGWNTYYLGANSPIESILETVVEQHADVVGISVTMTFHMSMAQALIHKIRSHPKVGKVKIIVGGYPFLIDDALWQHIGADGFAKDAKDAVTVAEALVTLKGASL